MNQPISSNRFHRRRFMKRASVLEKMNLPISPGDKLGRYNGELLEAIKEDTTENPTRKALYERKRGEKTK